MCRIPKGRLTTAVVVLTGQEVQLHVRRGDDMKRSHEIRLKQQGCATGRIRAQVHRAERVEECCGDLGMLRGSG